MVRKLLRIICTVLIFMGVLTYGGTTLSKFASDTQLKSPISVYEPVLNSMGVDLSLDVDTDINSESSSTKNDSGTVDVNADDEKDTEKSDSTKSDTQSTEKKETETKKELTVTKDDLNKLIESIRIVDGEKDGYDRTTYEKPIKSYKLNGKTYNRNDYAWKTSDYLVSENPFKYTCPYTGLTITDESKLDYDHIIPLHYVWNHTDWDADKMNEYAYDQSIGVDVQNSANRSKSDKGPSEWLPSVNIEDYCYTWLCIASEWDIALDKADMDVIKLQCLNAISSGHNLVRID